MIIPPGRDMVPNKEILAAFGASEEPTILSGGQGICYRSGNIVLKPIEDPVDSSWVADVYNGLHSEKFRVPKPIRATNGSWVFNNWIANEFISGKHIKGRYAEAVQISKDFHQALVGIPKPDFFEKRNDIWSIADRMAWGEIPVYDFELTNKPLKEIFDYLKPNELPNQVMHGDWGPGNILFDDTLLPAVIDFCPYWRPADFSIAVMMLDAIAWEGADETIFDLGKNIKDFDQLLFRGLVRRVCEYIGHQIHPHNDQDRLDGVKRYLNTKDNIIRKVLNRTINTSR